MGSTMRTSIGPAIPARPPPPLQMYFSNPDCPHDLEDYIPMNVVVSEHLPFCIISKRAFSKLKGCRRETGSSQTRISNLHGAHYIVQDKVVIDICPDDGLDWGFEEDFYIEATDDEAWDPAIDAIMSPQSRFFDGFAEEGRSSSVITAAYDFLTEVFIFTANNYYCRRRKLMVFFENDHNMMPLRIQEQLNIKMETYSGPPIQVPGHGKVKPIGTIKAPWKVVDRNKVYWTTFYVLLTLKYPDTLILGKSSVKEHGFLHA